MKHLLIVLSLLISFVATAQQFQHHQITPYFSTDIGVTPVVTGVAGTNVRANVIDLKAQIDGLQNSFATGLTITGTTTKTVAITRNNGLSTLTATFTDLAGSGADGVVSGASISGTTTKTITLTRTEGLPDIVISFQDNVNDADASPTNEINVFTRPANINTVTGTNGGGMFSVLDAYHTGFLTVAGQTFVQLPANPDLTLMSQFMRNGKLEQASKTQGSAYFYIDGINRISPSTGEPAFQAGEVIYYKYPIK
jgi:hypothetical protein